MKKLFILCLVAILFPMGLFAQITSGNINDGGTKPPKSNINQGAIHNSFFFAWGLTSSMGKFGNDVMVSNDVLTYGYGGMSKGISFTMGSNFYFKNIDFSKIGMSDKFKLGLDVTYLNVNFTRSYNTTMIDAIGDLMDVTAFFGVKVGPVFSYNPVGKLIIDAKFTLQPTVLIYDIIPYYSSDGYIDGSAFKVRSALGIYTKFKPFILGIELNWGRANFRELYVSEGGYYGNDAYYERKLGTTRFDFVFGFSF